MKEFKKGDKVKVNSTGYIWTIEGPAYYEGAFKLSNGSYEYPDNLTLNTPEIPERWCVKRTPENAEILNAWQCQRLQEKCYTSDTGYIHDQGSSDEIPYDYCIFEKTTTEHTEITFEQWQTIPEVAEWLKTYNMSTREAILKGVISTEKVEEREIIGYEAPRDLFGKRIKAGTVFTKCAITTISFEYIHGQTILPAEWVETWKPVYANPVFKVGDWIKVIDRYSEFYESILKVESIQKSGRYECSGIDCFEYFQIIAATPEEIEAAKPKPRKYMKQVWYVLVMDENFNSLLVSNQHETEEDANAWTLENSEEGRVYSVKPFEVVAYE